MKPTLQPALRELPYRDSAVVDTIVGKRKAGGAEDSGTVDWSQCPLAKHYPTWEVFHQQLADERREAKNQGRPAHRAAAPPLRAPRDHTPEQTTGLPSVGKVNARYETTDRGR